MNLLGFLHTLISHNHYGLSLPSKNGIKEGESATLFLSAIASFSLFILSSCSSLMMNSLLVVGEENAENHVSYCLCYICEKFFDNYQALGGHLRAYQGEIRARKNWHNPALFSKSIVGSSTNFNLLPGTQCLSPIKGTNDNLSHVPNRANFPLGFSNQIGLNGTTQMNSSKFFKDNLGIFGNQSIMSSALSAGSVKAEICPLDCLPYAPSASHVTAEFPSDNAMNLSSNGVVQNNTDVWGPVIADAQLYVMQKGQNFLPYNPNSLVYYCSPSSNYDPGSCSKDITQLIDTAISSLPQDLHQQPDQHEAIKFNKRNGLTKEGDKRPYFNDVPGSADKMSAPKRPKISSFPPVERETPQAKELPLITVMEKPLPRSQSFSSAKEEDCADLDLSLHL